MAEKPKFGIFALASSVSSTSRPATIRSNTANGFIDLIATASARCAASSLPDDVTNLTSRSRPHVSKYFSCGINMSWIAFWYVLGDLSALFFGLTGSVSSCASFGSTAMTVILSLVTPCHVAPPLSAPSFHAFTHTGPPPTTVESKRPYPPRSGSPCGDSFRHRGLSSAALVPMPEAATGGPAPFGLGSVAAPASVAVAMAGTTSVLIAAQSATSATANREPLPGRRTVMTYPPRYTRA